MAYVFISYSHTDAEFAENLKHRLEKAGFDEVWMDEERLKAGEDWREEIDEAIGKSFALILVVSPASRDSKYVMYEWSFAWDAHIKVVPLLLQDIGSNEIHPRLDKRQYLDFTNRNGRQWDKLIERLGDLEKEHTAENVHLPHDIPPFVEQAVAALESMDAKKRKKAIEGLTQSKHPAALDALAQAVQHHIRDVRIQAALTLAEITNYADQRAIPGLLEGRYEEDDSIKGKSFSALGKIGGGVVFDVLIESLVASQVE